MMRRGFRVIPLLALPMADSQTLSRYTSAGSYIAPDLSSAKSIVAALDQAIVSKQTCSAILVGQVRPDNIIEHVVFEGCYH
jgi:hypothetical protein